MAGIYNGHLLEFPQIRVDCFTTPPSPPNPPWLLPCVASSSSSPLSSSLDSYRPAPNAQLFLLSHVHSDHLLGLSDAFTGHIICTPDTKAMLLRLEAEMDRQYLVEGVREVGKRKYEGLKARILDKGKKTQRVIDRIETVPYGLPRDFKLGYEDGDEVQVSITLLNANHCPGSAMFLIKSADKAVLHTGDIRADNLFLQTLRRNPAIQEFIGPWSGGGLDMTENVRIHRGGRRVLDRIYVDTSAVLGTGDMPHKEPVLRDLLEQMSLYPIDTVFFLNVWCFGWEDVVKEVSRYFDAPIHVDRYKRSIFSAVKSDPFLKACTTLDPYATRFHACERRAKCESCRTFDRVSGKRVWNTRARIVHVNMVEVKTAAWAVQHQAFLEALGRAAIGEGQWPYNIDCPIARHSPLPELQSLVRLFRPRCLSPNTMLNEARGLDYFLLPAFFSDVLAHGGHNTLLAERDEWFTSSPKFGRAYVDRLKKMQSNGVELLPSLDAGSGRDEYLPESEDIEQNTKLGAGRKAHAVDQLARAGGLPRTFGGLTPATGQHISALLGMADISNTVGLAPTTSGPGRRYNEDDYDTDEEENIKRKRRRKVSTPIELKLETAADDARPVTPGGVDVKLEREKSAMLQDMIEPAVLEIKMEDIKPDIKPVIHAQSRRLPRFSVDKAHLRALSMVAQEVDDL